ncbi:hypothetical protein DPMN_094917 [Dreissena polymorpha]|uniref:Uncharacterized protein n=1 Tax=Dreissena polymorpha TaxID=45954 RepID=A0A9D4L5J8_DREPO|nr:hypothetical protein DPMN_094917 [Dreissena polymorpha]
MYFSDTGNEHRTTRKTSSTAADAAADDDDYDDADDGLDNAFNQVISGLVKSEEQAQNQHMAVCHEIV